VAYQNSYSTRPEPESQVFRVRSHKSKFKSNLWTVFFRSEGKRASEQIKSSCTSSILKRQGSSVQKGTVFRLAVRAFCSEMKMKELTPKQLSAVPCPTCGVASEQRCVLLSGAPRNEPHVRRKIAATEAVEKRRFKVAAD
jgi:hypothetical protein